MHKDARKLAPVMRNVIKMCWGRVFNLATETYFSYKSTQRAQRVTSQIINIDIFCRVIIVISSKLFEI